MASEMMCAMRRQFSGVVKYCWPIIWVSPKTSQRRKSTRSLPSGCACTCPATSACALIARQLPNCGGVLMLASLSMKDLGSSGWNRPDLERSGLFQPLDPKSFIDKLANINTPPQFGSWRAINAQALVAGQVQAQPDGRLLVDFRLWDVFGETQMIGQQYFTTPENWRRIAHIISDAIYERITGEKGYFDTRIVFVSES